MIGEEAEEAPGGIVQHARDGCRPDRRGHRQQIPLAQAAAEAVPGEEPPEGQVVSAGLLEVAQARPVEADDVQQHAHERRPQQVGALGEERFQRASSVLQRAIGDAGGEGHCRGLGPNAELGEQAREQGVGVLVVDHEAGVDRYHAGGRGDRDGMAVAADAAIRLEHGDLMPGAEQPGRGKPGDTGADNSNPHL